MRAESEGDAKPAAKGIFSFVTDNESSRTAIQITSTNRADGNVGQMIEVRARDVATYGREAIRLDIADLSLVARTSGFAVAGISI